MARRGRSASPPPAQRRMAQPAARPAPVAARPAPVAAAPRPAAASPPMVQQSAPSAVGSPMGAPQQPSMFAQMAATAGGVAVGSAIGHVAGSALTGAFSSKDEPAQAAPAAAAPQQAYNGHAHQEQQGGACAWEIKQFLNCAENQSDITLCQGFNEAMRQCKQQYGM